MVLELTSSAMLNRSGKTGHPCLLPSLRGKPSSFPWFSLLLALGFFVDVLRQAEETPLCSQLAESFYHGQVLDFVSCFFDICRYTIYFLWPFDVMDHIIVT